MVHLQSPLRLLLRPTHGALRPTASRRPQPYAVHRLRGAGAHPRRASRDRPPRPDRPAGRGHRGAARQPRHRPPAVEPEIPPDGQGHQRSRLGARLRHTLGLRAGYPMSREWLTLGIRRMDAVASVYRLAASMSPGIDGQRSRVEFHRRGRFDAAITLHDGRSFGIVRQGRSPSCTQLYACNPTFRTFPIGDKGAFPLPTVLASNNSKRGETLQTTDLADRDSASKPVARLRPLQAPDAGDVSACSEDKSDG